MSKGCGRCAASWCGWRLSWSRSSGPTDRPGRGEPQPWVLLAGEVAGLRRDDLVHQFEAGLEKSIERGQANDHRIHAGHRLRDAAAPAQAAATPAQARCGRIPPPESA